MAWIELGRLGAPYGIRGWVHVDSYTDPPEGLLKYRDWALRLASGERLTRRLGEGRTHGQGLVAQLEGVASREAAAALTGAVIEVERAALPPAGENEFYRADLEGLAVRNLEGVALGVVSHFVDAPGGTLMVTRESNGREHWVLVSPRHLRTVDLATRVIVVDWPADGPAE
ncbi:MAG TPA: ribosome maturation factor RimM [Steroidobacteraceae bacterium]|nr:ribosome maturation factor RimM [Steroidobacteraceae bacterium]